MLLTVYLLLLEMLFVMKHVSITSRLMLIGDSNNNFLVALLGVSPLSSSFFFSNYNLYSAL
jgi:hypothetical protein